MKISDRDVYWCRGCCREFQLEQLKTCSNCRTATYCSLECQKSAWKDGHKTLCREIVANKHLLKAWVSAWDSFIRWAAVRAFDLTNKPGNHRNRCLELNLLKVNFSNFHYAYEILGGGIKPLDVEKEVRFESGSSADGGDITDQLYVSLLVWGKGGEFIEAIGLNWALPSRICDKPEKSKMWAKHCVWVMKWVTAFSRPRHAISYATLLMNVTLGELGRFDLCSGINLRRRRLSAR